MRQPLRHDSPATLPSEGPEWESILRGIRSLARQRRRLAARCRRLKAALDRAKRRRAARPIANGTPAPPEVILPTEPRETALDDRGRPSIPGYSILGTIRDGSMGRVYLARQESLGRLVAIKALRGHLASAPEYAERFLREARLAGGLGHPHIVQVLDAGRADGRPYLVMEYVPGETAQDRLDRGRAFGEREAVEVALAVARALGHARRRGLVHRDVKPGNLLLSADGVKLIDWGLARPEADEEWAIAEAGSAIGTPQYLSPEQFRGQSDVDIRCDLYGLGATLYHMVTGRLPHGGDSAAEVMRKHTDPRVPLAPPDSVEPSVSARFAAVIAKLMARRREDRYRDPDDLVLDLERLLRGDRPLLADPPDQALADLSLGEVSPGRAGRVAPIESEAVEAPEVPRAVETNWGPLVVGNLLLLAAALAVAAGLLVAA